MDLATAIHTLGAKADPTRVKNFKVEAIERALAEGMSGVDILKTIVGVKSQRARVFTNWSDERIIREAKNLTRLGPSGLHATSTPLPSISAMPDEALLPVDKAVRHFNLLFHGKENLVTGPEERRRADAMRAKLRAGGRDATLLRASFDALRSKYPLLQQLKLKYADLIQVVARTSLGIHPASSSGGREVPIWENVEESAEGFHGTQQYSVPVGTNRAVSEAQAAVAARPSAEVKDGQAATKFLQDVKALDRLYLFKLDAVNRATATKVRALEQGFTRECDKLRSAVEGQDVASLLKKYADSFHLRRQTLQEEGNRNAAQVFRDIQKAMREAQDEPTRARWRSVARRRGNFTGEYSGPVRKAYEILERYQAFTFHTTPPADPRQTASERGRRAWLDEAQERAGWPAELRTGGKSEREDMAKRINPMIAAIKEHIGRLTLKAEEHGRQINGAAIKYKATLEAKGITDEQAAERGTYASVLKSIEKNPGKEHLRDIRKNAEEINRIEERIEKLHREWMHLEEIVESGTTADESSESIKSRKSTPSDSEDVIEALRERVERTGITGTQNTELVSRALRTIKMAEDSYHRQVKGLEPAQRPGTTAATDWEFKIGRFKGLKFSEVPVSHLLWLAMGARIKKGSAKDYVQVGKVRVKLPFKVPRTYYQDIERVPDSMDEATKRGSYSNMPRGARAYLRSAEGARRVEAWRKEYIDTPWEEQVYVITGQAPVLDARYTKYQEIMQLDKNKRKITKLGEAVQREMLKAVIKGRVQLDAERRESLPVYDEKLRILRLNAMSRLGITRMDKLPPGVLRKTKEKAKEAYEADLARRGINDFAIMYKHAIHELGMRPEEADWHVKNILRDSATKGKFRVLMGFQDSNLTEEARKEIEEDGEKYFTRSQRAMLEFVKWAGKRRESLSSIADGVAPTNEERYAKELASVETRARQAYQQWVRVETEERMKLLPLSLRAKGDRYGITPKPFEELTWEDIFKLGKQFDAGGRLLQPGQTAGGAHSEFLIPADTLAFHPGVIKAELSREFLSPKEKAKVDPLFRAQSDDWYKFTLKAPGAGVKFSQIADLINRATNTRQLDTGLRALLYSFYRGTNEESVLQLFEQTHDPVTGAAKYAISDARALLRSLDFQDAPTAMRAAISDYVVRRHDILTGRVGDVSYQRMYNESGALRRDMSTTHEWESEYGEAGLPGRVRGNNLPEFEGYNITSRHELTEEQHILGYGQPLEEDFPDEDFYRAYDEAYTADAERNRQLDRLHREALGDETYDARMRRQNDPLDAKAEREADLLANASGKPASSVGPDSPLARSEYAGEAGEGWASYGPSDDNLEADAEDMKNRKRPFSPE